MSEQSSVPNISPGGSAGRKWRLSRRGFLIGGGIAGAGLALGISFGVPAARLRIAETLDSGTGRPGGLPSNPWAWFEILPDNTVRLFLSKVEMGQGVHTALAQIAVEELGIEWGTLEVHQATTHVGPDDNAGTSGSSSISSVYTPLRQAAATLRHMLMGEAARTLNVEVGDLRMGDRLVISEASGKSISFGELVAAQPEWEIPGEDPPLKDFHAFEVIGQPLGRVDIPAKVTGEAIYGYDVRIEGMKYGAVLRPPSIEGTLVAVEEGTARDAPGVAKIVIEKGFAGVVADSRAQARAAITQMEAEWNLGKLWQQDELEALVTAGGRGGITIQKKGNAAGVLASDTRLSAHYRSPFAVQTPLEAQAALAHVHEGSVRIWVATQMHGMVRGVVAEALGVDEDVVEIIPTYLGGGFGRKSGFEVAVEAARLSRAAGVPVHVGWDRTEELRYGYFRPPTHHELLGKLDQDGRIEAMEHRQASGDVAFGFLPKFMETVMGADFGATRGARVHYDIPNLRTIAWRRKLPVQTGWWRGLGLFANTFAVECFMDEMASSAGAEPLQFRLDHLRDDHDGRRMRAVLETVAEESGWGGTPLKGRARGIACCTDVGTTVAQVAEVSVDSDTGKIRVHRVTSAMDCGLVINPDGAVAQVEGNIVWGIGSTLLEVMRVRNGQVDLTNFNDYPLITMKETPQIDTILLEAGDGIPRGVGEPPIGPVGAAIGNALFALTGVRMRELPLSPQHVLTALDKPRPHA